MRVLAAGSFSAFLLLLVTVVTDWSPLRRLDLEFSSDANGYVAVRPDQARALRVLSDWIWDPISFRVAVACVLLGMLPAGVRRVRALAVWAAATLLVGLVAVQVVKSAVGRLRPRPEHPVDTAPGYSFPSGHATTGMLGAGVLAVVLLVVLRGVWRKVVVGLAVFSAVGVGVSRVLLGVHWSSDVLAGWTLGAGCLAVALLLGRRYGVFERAEPGDGAVAGT